MSLNIFVSISLTDTPYYLFLEEYVTTTTVLIAISNLLMFADGY